MRLRGPSPRPNPETSSSPPSRRRRYATAIRRTELTRLKLHDIDHGRALVAVRQGKGKKDRIVPLGARARAWVEVYLEKARPHLVVGRDPDILFLTSSGQAIAPKKLSDKISGYVRPRSWARAR